MLKKIFPLSFKFSADVPNLIVGVFIYAILGLIGGALITLATMIVGWIPVIGAIIGWIAGIIGAVIELYVLFGILIEAIAFASNRK